MEFQRDPRRALLSARTLTTTASGTASATSAARHPARTVRLTDDRLPAGSCPGNPWLPHTSRRVHRHGPHCKKPVDSGGPSRWTCERGNQHHRISKSAFQLRARCDRVGKVARRGTDVSTRSYSVGSVSRDKERARNNFPNSDSEVARRVSEGSPCIRVPRLRFGLPDQDANRELNSNTFLRGASQKPPRQHVWTRRVFCGGLIGKTFEMTRHALRQSAGRGNET